MLKGVEYHFWEWGHSACAVDLALKSSASDNALPRHERFASERAECEHRFRGAWVSGGDLCAAETPTEPTGETRGGFSAKAPLTGLIDAYNDAHPIKEIMESLSDIYEATDTENRYMLIGSDSTPGVIIDPEKNIATSFHANDPAQGKPLNSFDLYRIHRFGELDKDCSRDTQKNELPSFKAMLDFAKKDKKVQKLLAEHREKFKPKRDPIVSKIMQTLQRNNKGEPKNCSANAVMIVQNDPKL